MKKIVSFFGEPSEVFRKLNERAAQYAREKGFEYEWAPQIPFDPADVIARLKNADVGIIDVEPYNDEIFSQIQGSTRLLVRFGVGYDKVDLDAAARRGIAVARTAGANTPGVAEMAISLILALRRKLEENQACVRRGAWKKIVVHELIQSTVGIVGFGSIGHALTKLLSGFDCRILAYDPFCSKEAMAEAGAEKVELEELFAQSDAISLHLPYTKETHNLVSDELLSKMKPSAVLVNTARGNIIDEDALYRVLSQKKIAGAALDVFAQEPLPLTSPLLKLDNILLTPHVSSQTEESLWRIYAMAIDIAEEFERTGTSRHILNPGFAKNKT